MLNIIYQYNLHYIFRIIIAGICGILIGYERKNRAKEAGLRTHCIVACASALMMIISKYAFFDLVQDNLYQGADIRLDPSRVAQGIVSGVGFLGAGMIFVRKNTIKGLTTAAGIWATSGIGMAIGSGMYTVGLFSTIILLVIQFVLHINSRFTITPRSKKINFYGVNEANFQETITDKLDKLNIGVNNVSIERTSNIDGLKYSFYIDIFSNVTEEELLNLCDYDCKIES